MQNALARLALFSTGCFAGKLPGRLCPLHLRHITGGVLLAFFCNLFCTRYQKAFETEIETFAVGNDLPEQIDCCIKILSKFGLFGKSLTEGFFFK